MATMMGEHQWGGGSTHECHDEGGVMKIHKAQGTNGPSWAPHDKYHSKGTKGKVSQNLL